MTSPILRIAVIGDAPPLPPSRHHLSRHDADEVVDADIVISSVAHPKLQRTPQLFVLTDATAELPSGLPYSAALLRHGAFGFYVAANQLAATMLELLLNEHGIKAIAVESPEQLRTLTATLKTLKEAATGLRKVLSEDDVQALLADS